MFTNHPGIAHIALAYGTREEWLARYSPGGARAREESFAALTDGQLRELLSTSQPAYTAPETEYRR